MAGLISREAAIEWIDKCVALSGIGCEPVIAIRDIKALISVLPAVDAVPVVRCRDCRYWRQEVTPTEHWICIQHSSNGRRMHTTPDFYCKDGMVSK